jgi:Leu/Phe-tRNA-protein transferase
METIQLGIHHLPYDVITDRGLLEKLIYPNMRKNYYWSEDFSADYYIAQAKAGFIAVTDYFEEEELLLPEIQFAYTLLDFEDLHISRKVQTLLKRKAPKLVIGEELDEIAHAIEMTHRNNWLTPQYLNILKETKGKDENFKIISAAIYEENKPVAGEIGYIIGKTYTSLSGFTRREKRHNNYGTAQLVLLAQYLQKEGFAFWNLGQPYMVYKFALGAKVYERADFLERWFEATQQKS